MQLYGKRVEESTEGPITHPHTNKKKKIIMIEITTSPSTEGGGHTNKHTLFFGFVWMSFGPQHVIESRDRMT